MISTFFPFLPLVCEPTARQQHPAWPGHGKFPWKSRQGFSGMNEYHALFTPPWTYGIKKQMLIMLSLMHLVNPKQDNVREVFHLLLLAACCSSLNVLNCTTLQYVCCWFKGQFITENSMWYNKRQKKILNTSLGTRTAFLKRHTRYLLVTVNWGYIIICEHHYLLVTFRLDVSNFECILVWWHIAGLRHVISCFLFLFLN